MRALSGMTRGVTLLAVSALVPCGGRAAEQPKPAVPAKAELKAEFLEYLALFEGAEENWTDFELEAEPAPAAKPAPSRTDKTDALP
jgi:hypothetical protein